MGALLEKSPIALAFNRILCGPLSYKMKAHPVDILMPTKKPRGQELTIDVLRSK
jgi:hypothetical protein